MDIKEFKLRLRYRMNEKWPTKEDKYYIREEDEVYHVVHRLLPLLTDEQIEAALIEYRDK